LEEDVVDLKGAAGYLLDVFLQHAVEGSRPPDDGFPTNIDAEVATA
jgi:hypothetical protein